MIPNKHRSLRRIAFQGVASLGLPALFVAVALTRAAGVPAQSGAKSDPGSAPAAKLIVHEWGTFTGFAGSDGVHLPFNTNIGSDLPGFVMNRLTQSASQDRNMVGLLFVKAGGASALQRMETPVIYFYTDVPRDVEARVDFPQGLLTEFYPPVRSFAPAYGQGLGEPKIDDRPVTPAAPLPSVNPSAESFLDWGKIHLVPHPAGDEGKHLAPVPDKNRYAPARETDADLVQFTGALGETNEEKFLFYRGLGNFSLPVTLSAVGGDRFELHNAGPAPIGWAFLIQNNGHAASRFARFENLVGNHELKLPPAGAAPGDLPGEIVRSLVASGLYEKEARAMVQTWKSSWLDEPGTRVLYVVPRPVTDALLPLRISPVPDQSVRVLVGRIDVLTPELEARLRSTMRGASAQSDTDAASELSDADVQLLSGLGRFLDPALVRAGEGDKETARAQAKRLENALWKATAAKK